MKINSIANLIMKYRSFNKQFFNNSLPNNITFSFANVTSFFGQVRIKNNVPELRINSNIDWVDESQYENTIIHEMIHVYQWCEFKKMDHLKTFKEQANKIAILSNNKYIITRLSTSEEKGYVINEKVVKDKSETVYVLANQKTHRVFRKASLSELKSLVMYSKELKLEIFEYTGKAFLQEKSGSIYTKSYMLFYNKNNEYEMLCNEAKKVF